MGMTGKLTWRKSPRAIVNKRVLKGSGTALFMAETWRRLYNPFVPMDTGFLANDGVGVSAAGNVGKIHHSAHYAVFVYYGAGKNFSKSKHALATDRWDEAAKRAGKLEVLKGDMQRFIKRGG